MNLAILSLACVTLGIANAQENEINIEFAGMLSGFSGKAEPSEGRKRMRVMGLGWMEPLNYYKDNSLLGYDVDIKNQLIHDLKIDANYELFQGDDWPWYIDSSYGVGTNKKCLWDFAVAWTSITQARIDAGMKFSHPYGQAEYVVIVKESDPATHVNDLASVRIQVPEGTVFVDVAHELADGMLPGFSVSDATVTEMGGLDDLSYVRSNDYDATITDSVNWFNGNQTGLKLLEGSLGEDLWGITVCPNNEGLLTMINEIIMNWHEDGTLEALNARYGWTKPQAPQK